MDALQCKMARAALGWGVRDLARESGVSSHTISRLERGEKLKEKTMVLIQAAFNAAGIEFFSRNDGGPGVLLTKNEKGSRPSIPKGSEPVITTGQIRAARGFLGLSQVELARLANLSVPTIKRSERDHANTGNVSTATLNQIRAAFERAGIEFIDGHALGVRLAKSD